MATRGAVAESCSVKRRPFSSLDSKRFVILRCYHLKIGTGPARRICFRLTGNTKWHAKMHTLKWHSRRHFGIYNTRQGFDPIQDFAIETDDVCPLKGLLLWRFQPNVRRWSARKPTSTSDKFHRLCKASPAPDNKVNASANSHTMRVFRKR